MTAAEPGQRAPCAAFPSCRQQGRAVPRLGARQEHQPRAQIGGNGGEQEPGRSPEGGKRPPAPCWWPDNLGLSWDESGQHNQAMSSALATTQPLGGCSPRSHHALQTRGWNKLLSREVSRGNVHWSDYI